MFPAHTFKESINSTIIASNEWLHAFIKAESSPYRSVPQAEFHRAQKARAATESLIPNASMTDLKKANDRVTTWIATGIALQTAISEQIKKKEAAIERKRQAELRRQREAREAHERRIREEKEAQERRIREERARKQREYQQAMLLKKRQQSLLQRKHLFAEQTRDSIKTANKFISVSMDEKTPGNVLEMQNLAAATQIELLKGTVKGIYKDRELSKKEKEEFSQMGIGLVDEWKEKLGRKRIDPASEAGKRMTAYVDAFETVMTHPDKVAKMPDWKLDSHEITQEAVSGAMGRFLGAGHVLSGQLKDVENRKKEYEERHKAIENRGRRVKKKKEAPDTIVSGSLMFDVRESRFVDDDAKNGLPDLQNGRTVVKFDTCGTCNKKMKKSKLKIGQWQCSECGKWCTRGDVTYYCRHPRGVDNRFACVDCVEKSVDVDGDVDVRDVRDCGQSKGKWYYPTSYF